MATASILPTHHPTARSWFGFGRSEAPATPSRRFNQPLPPPPPASTGKKLSPPPRGTAARPSATIDLWVPLHKPRGAPLGVRFDASGDGAVIETVEVDGRAWRARLRPGDTVVSLRVLQTGSERALASGYDAAQALRPAEGRLVLHVRRHRPTPADAAASAIQAGWAGWAVRRELREAARLAAAATRIQSHWRRCVAAADVWNLALELEEEDAEDEAALLLQCHWRRWCAEADAWDRRLAVRQLQAAARGLVSRLRSRRVGRAGGKRRCIRSPPCLGWGDE